jgi:SPP1 family predicted phage head-tail adaptor
MISAGKLRHRVTIEQPAITQNPLTGEITEGWGTFAANLPAAIEPLSARDFIQSAAMQSEITTRITVRYLAGIKPNMRVVNGDTIYNIRGVLVRQGQPPRIHHHAMRRGAGITDDAAGHRRRLHLGATLGPHEACRHRCQRIDG